MNEATAMRAYRVSKQSIADRIELSRLDDGHWDQPYLGGHTDGTQWRQRVTTAKVKHLLLINRTIISSGEVRYLKVKRLGFGVCEIWFEPRRES